VLCIAKLWPHSLSFRYLFFVTIVGIVLAEGFVISEGQGQFSDTGAGATGLGARVFCVALQISFFDPPLFQIMTSTPHTSPQLHFQHFARDIPPCTWSQHIVAHSSIAPILYSSSQTFAPVMADDFVQHLISSFGRLLKASSSL
jgi:hypothetical protein